MSLSLAIVDAEPGSGICDVGKQQIRRPGGCNDHRIVVEIVEALIAEAASHLELKVEVARGGYPGFLHGLQPEIGFSQGQRDQEKAHCQEDPGNRQEHAAAQIVHHRRLRFDRPGEQRSRRCEHEQPQHGEQQAKGRSVPAFPAHG